MAHCCVEFYPPSIQGNHKWRNHQSVVVTHYSILVVWITRDKKKTVNDYKWDKINYPYLIEEKPSVRTAIYLEISYFHSGF